MILSFITGICRYKEGCFSIAAPVVRLSSRRTAPPGGGRGDQDNSETARSHPPAPPGRGRSERHDHQRVSHRVERGPLALRGTPPERRQLGRAQSLATSQTVLRSPTRQLVATTLLAPASRNAAVRPWMPSPSTTTPPAVRQ